MEAALTSAQAQGAVTQWLNFLDEVEHRYKGLRVTNFSIADYDYVANNTQAVSTNLITGTLEIYMCVSDKEADSWKTNLRIGEVLMGAAITSRRSRWSRRSPTRRSTVKSESVRS